MFIWGYFREKNRKVDSKKTDHSNFDKDNSYCLLAFLCAVLSRREHSISSASVFDLTSQHKHKDYSMLLKTPGKHNFLGYLAFCHSAMA